MGTDFRKVDAWELEVIEISDVIVIEQSKYWF